MNSQMHARCAVPVTPEQLQLSPGSFLLSHADDAGVAPRMTFDRSYAPADDVRWSARRTLVFIMASNGALWWIIAYVLRSVT